jgi:hypothetical protein
VAASVRQLYQGTLTLGDGRSFVGAMISDTDVPSARLLYAADAPAPGASRRDAALCVPGALDAELVESAAVVCDRGEVARLDKSRAVRRAGGLAMVLANTGPDSVDADLHAVPTVHLGAADGRAVKAYISGAGGAARASIEADSGPEQTPPRILEFSSRGPTPDGGVLKPDLAAPGGNVLAAVSPAAAAGRPWDFGSGTSVATAHVAGLAARVLAAHPDWSPAAVRSAMMTTALAGAAQTTPFEAGAGEVSARRALDPGLVYDAAPATSRGRPSSLNLPSISVPALVGSATVHRTVTNVADSAETYTAKVTGLHGVDAAVVPDAFTLAPGESASFRVTFSAKKHARYGRFVAGDLVWRGSAGHRARSPLVVRAQAVEAPDEVTGATLDGSLFVDLTAGVTGTLDVRESGLVGATPVDVALSPGGGFDPATPAADTATYQQTTQVSEGAEAMRVQVDAADDGDDFDLYVYRDGRLVAASNGGSAGEVVTLRRPAPGSYQVYVNLAAGSSGAEATVTSWVLDPSRTTRLALGPRPMTVDGGAPFRLRVGWSDLDQSRRWWGYLDYSRHAGRTYLTLD